MPISASNFTSNSLSGAVYVSGGNVSVSLTPVPYALEGDKSFVIKIRKGDATGIVVATSAPITLKDRSSFVSLTANTATVNEGDLVAFTLVTANAVNNANLFYSVFPVTANVTAGDFTANTGTLTVTNNAGTFALKANADISLMDETGETFRVQLRTNDVAGNVVFVTSNVVILDTYKTYNVLSFVENVTSPIAEGSNVTFTFTATNIPAGTILYYNTTGNLTNFLSNTGSFVMNGTSNTFTITNPQVPANALRIYNVVVRSASTSGPIVATSNNITVTDSSLAYTVATGGTVVDDGGFRSHVFTTSGNLVISSVGTTFNTLEYQVVAGGGGGADGYIEYGGGGGGAGGLIYSNNIIAVAATMPIIVGAGGSPAGYDQKATNGSPSVFNANTAIGGGGGGGKRNLGSGGIRAGDGGSGGGGMYGTFPPGGGVDRGSGTPGQGNPGGESMYTTPFGGYTMNSGGGGGAGSRGYTWNDGTYNDGNTANVGGGIGRIAMSLPASYGTPGPAPGRYFAGGGGGGFADRPGSNMVPGPGGAGGGGGGAGRPGAPQSGPGTNGTTNTGGGGGGGSYPSYYTIYPGRTGGSGIVIVRYPYVPPPTFTSITSLSGYDFVKAGSNLTLTINTLNLANNTMLYYSTVGNVTTSNFVSGNTGSFRSTDNSTTLILGTTSLPANEERFFQLQINPDGVGEIAAITSNVLYIRDTALVSLGGSSGTQSNIEGYRVHLFAAPQSGSTMTFSRPGTIEYLMAGGGGGAMATGGGGAGGLLIGTTTVNAGNTYTITVGSGGFGPSQTKAGNTIAFGFTAFAGGTASNNGANGAPGKGEDGGSGAGGGVNGGGGYGGDGVPGQGNPGGYSGPSFVGGGGGGAASSGQGFIGPSPGAARGGNGIWSTITGSNVAYSGGGGGGYNNPAPTILNGVGGGSANYGGGAAHGAPGQGGPGVVIIRYPV